MRTFDLEALLEIQKECVSASSDDSYALFRWLTSVGISPVEFGKFLDHMGDAISELVPLFEARGEETTDIMTALYAAGFELGIRFQQVREVIV